MSIFENGKIQRMDIFRRLKITDSFYWDITGYVFLRVTVSTDSFAAWTFLFF